MTEEVTELDLFADYAPTLELAVEDSACLQQEEPLVSEPERWGQDEAPAPQGTIWGDWEAPAATLQSRFGAPPFSVLDARQGYWQERKRRWLALGLQSELGRGANLLKYSAAVNAKHSGIGRNYDETREALARMEGGDVWSAAGTSIFDPVLCELAYRWFCPPGGLVLDPFAGGSVRGVVAGVLGRQYVGIDLREEQCAANRAQLETICPRAAVRWEAGDSMEFLPNYTEQVDFVFTCPPYFDLEEYSGEDGRDLSAMGDEGFSAAFRSIVGHACAKLKADRFACFVVGNARAKGAGHLRDLCSLTVAAAQAAGLQYYNDAILVTSVGTLPLRINRQFCGSRKLGRTHQYVLVFLKGNGAKAGAAMEQELLDE